MIFSMRSLFCLGEGKTVGEIALLKDDCIRTASVVCDCETDLIMIERNLYNRYSESIFCGHSRLANWTSPFVT